MRTKFCIRNADCGLERLRLRLHCAAATWAANVSVFLCFGGGQAWCNLQTSFIHARSEALDEPFLVVCLPVSGQKFDAFDKASEPNNWRLFTLGFLRHSFQIIGLVVEVNDLSVTRLFNQTLLHKCFSFEVTFMRYFVRYNLVVK